MYDCSFGIVLLFTLEAMQIEKRASRYYRETLDFVRLCVTLLKVIMLFNYIFHDDKGLGKATSDLCTKILSLT